tara:strand:+ start:3895 stop:4578 length:684 start_codon:yes stop_codon:yes gene_type:complete
VKLFKQETYREYKSARIYRHETYEDYKNAQEICATNGEKNIWISNKEIDLLTNHMVSNIGGMDFGLCHGVRNGYEVNKLYDKLIETKKVSKDFKLVGTEISKFASKYKNVIQWDFHEIKDEWVKKADFIYSNSIDHSYNPRLALSQWFKCLKPNVGNLYLHWSGPSQLSDDPTPADMFQAGLEDFKKIILSIDNTHIKEVFDIPYSSFPGDSNTVHGLKVIVAGIKA